MSNIEIATITDMKFIQQFEDQSLDPKYFNHLGHLRLAYLYLSMYDFYTAENKICNGIQQYAKKLGATTKYHKTITCALLQLIHIRMQQNQLDSWQMFFQVNDDLVKHAMDLLLARYSKDRLFSDQARMSFIEPDLAPL